MVSPYFSYCCYSLYSIFLMTGDCYCSCDQVLWRTVDLADASEQSSSRGDFLKSWPVARRSLYAGVFFLFCLTLPDLLISRLWNEMDLRFFFVRFSHWTLKNILCWQVICKHSVFRNQSFSKFYCINKLHSSLWTNKRVYCFLVMQEWSNSAKWL